MLLYDQKCAELALAVDDYYLVVGKLLTNDITSRVLVVANERKCSVQEAIGDQLELAQNLYSESKQLMEQLANSEDASDQFREYLTAGLRLSEVMYPILTKVMKVFENPDHTIGSERWSQMYDDLLKERIQAIPFDL